MATRRGLFVTFEGPDGAGKTTQIRLLAEALRERGLAVTRTREPGGDVVGERVRDLLLHAGPDEIRAETELLLFAAARVQNVSGIVRPALESGQVVLCDRFTDSTVAYQGHARGLALDFIEQVNRFATGGLVPDRTFLLDLPPAAGLARQRAGEQDRLDSEDLAFHERVRAGFRERAARAPERIVVLDAARPVDSLAKDILADILPLLGRGKE